MIPGDWQIKGSTWPIYSIKVDELIYLELENKISTSSHP